jgi:hypothetical protein
MWARRCLVTEKERERKREASTTRVGTSRKAYRAEKEGRPTYVAKETDTLVLPYEGGAVSGKTQKRNKTPMHSPQSRTHTQKDTSIYPGTKVL